MNCLDCAKQGNRTPAVAICHSCSAALCLEHVQIMPNYIEATRPVCGTDVLPVPGRLILCGTCRKAMEQHRLARTA